MSTPAVVLLSGGLDSATTAWQGEQTETLRRRAALVFLLLAALLTLLAAITLAIIAQRDLFGVVILAGIYSFLMASVLIVLE